MKIINEILSGTEGEPGLLQIGAGGFFYGVEAAELLEEEQAAFAAYAGNGV